MTHLSAAGERSAVIPADPVRLPGVLAWPRPPAGMVLFAHDSVSSRLSMAWSSADGAEPEEASE